MDLPQIKVYKIDYQFLIDNYLDVRLWNKTWNVFSYKDFDITVQINSIKCQEKVIVFQFTNYLTYSSGGRYSIVQNVEYYLNSDNGLQLFQKRVNRCILRLLELQEEWELKKTSRYSELCNLVDEIECTLVERAKDYLNDNDIYLEDVRDAYIDWFIDKNTVENYPYDYLVDNARKLLSDYYIAYYQATNDNTNLNEMKEIVGLEEYEEIVDKLTVKLEEMETMDYTEFTYEE